MNSPIVKNNIKGAIEDYQNDKSSSLSKGRKIAVQNLMEAIDGAGSIQELYDTVKKAQNSAIQLDVENHNMLLNRNGSRYQQVLDNVLDKIVATGGRKHDAQAALEGIKELVAKLPDNNKV